MTAAADFRSPFARRLGFTPATGILLLVVFGVVRVVLVLQANVTGSYSVVSTVFIAMAVLPWIVLTKSGRRRIGLVRPSRWRWVLPAALVGAATAALVHLIGSLFWGAEVSNPFVYIAQSYSQVPTDLDATDRLIFFAIFAVIGMTFSPIGEELLYRGLAHESFAARLGDRAAALIDAGAFALVHLAHFGIVYVSGVWQFLPFPALFWLTAMFGASLVFYTARRFTGSLVGAIVAHAGFNLVMNAIIFYAILA